MTETALPGMGNGTRDTNKRSTAASVVESNDGTTDYLVLYREYCAEEGCKANSAFVRYIQDRGGHFTLERLDLGNNYLGSKGLRPVLRMIDLCQTIVSVNLEGNGISNEAVADLCDVVQRHVSIASLNLSHNPISVAGGKRLLQLVESNPRITAVLLDGTDIFKGLQARIRMAVQQNIATQRMSGLHMEVNREVVSPSAAAAAVATAAATVGGKAATEVHVRTPSPLTQQRGASSAHASTMPAVAPPKASLKPIHHRSQRSIAPINSADSGTSRRAAAITTGRSTGVKSDARKAATSGSVEPALGRYTWQEAALGKLQPRPPHPAVASQELKVLPPSKVKDLKALFAERAQLHMEVNRGEASRRAYAARQELLALEHHGRTAGVVTSGTSPQTYPGSATEFLPMQETPSSRNEVANPTCQTFSGVSAVSGREASPMDASASGEPASAKAPPRVPPCASSTSLPPLTTPATAASANGQPPVTSARLPTMTTAVSPDGTAVQERQEAHTIEDVLSPARMMLLTTEEQFVVLFDQGCREYANRNLDAAYMAWNEAMRVAVSEGQREWMAVVATNLQRLSYELLVEEGSVHLEQGRLEKAQEAFKLAFEVAVKAKNAAWEHDMRTAQQNVQKALFHRCHEAALLLFRRAQEDMSVDPAATKVTEDDYFVLPGTDELVRHTPAFVREWSCLLVLKEAVGLWAEATRVIGRLSQVAAAPLKHRTTEALSLLAAFIAEHHFNATPPTGLTWFGTDAFLYHECILLSELWRDLLTYSEQNLRHDLMSAMCAAQLGELYVATYQLPQALVQLNKLVAFGQKHKSSVLEATGLTLCGRVHLQRANYALAKVALEDALRLWSRLQHEPASKVAAEDRDRAASGRYSVPLMDAAAAIADEENAGAAGTTADVGGPGTDSGRALATDAKNGSPSETLDVTAEGGDGGFPMLVHLPTDAVANLANACRHYKVSLLLRTYQYSAALEALESGLNEAYSDTLREKMRRNFHLSPSLDEIVAISGALNTPLIYYVLTTRYDWAVKDNKYTAEELLNMWVVAESREMRYVEVNLTKEFKCTLRSLVSSLRERLCLEPEMAVRSEIITELPQRTWQEPLRILYQMVIYPILGYVRALNPQMLFGDGVITVVPTGPLWLVPFHALLDVKAGDRYLVEEVAVQMAFSATQAAFGALSANRVQQLGLHRQVVAVQRESDHGIVDSPYYTSFPFYADRSEEEGTAVAAMLTNGQKQLAQRFARHAPAEAAIFTCKVEVVDDDESLRVVLPQARSLHIATATTAALPPSQIDHADFMTSRPEDEGGVLMRTASPMGDVGVMRAAEIAHMELAAEHVILTNTNISPLHVDGIRDDVLGLARGFFASGVPCVVAGQWCTPDMKPMELFRYFYTRWCHLSSAETLEPSIASTEETERTALSSRVPRSVATGDEGEEGTGDDEFHRALLLARSIRQLLAEEPAMRYHPRAWAGYYCMGAG